ncbi:bifunctional 5,10-methylene-tetrahydrofolate dehydrogenase/5,10-methylene-tetrahydrofolate cyclohydrolase [candidate division KSB1 bacterium]|nr:bifunctional 5,10-methylene-tetrahydrofolate dehydrogenase/5,10-methylene-tetrahydrofolate cyclohydrolase [candidate division KSB1 bacterium]
MVQIIDGKAISDEIKAELKNEIEELRQRGITPKLTTILVGDDPASASYVRMKGKACDRLGMLSDNIPLPESTSQSELLAQIEKLAHDPAVHGILVQLPLPKHINETIILNAIPPEKDVDGFHPINKGRLAAGEDTFVPCTPAGIQEMLVRSGHNPEGKHIVIVGRSQIVGMPLAQLLMHKKKGANATVTVCHTGTRDMGFFTRQADIIVAAMGRPETITGEMVRPGCVVIDVGSNRIDDPECEKGYRFVGDVHFESVSKKAAAISPVPGGVGPMTITMLMKNTVKAAGASHSG